MKDELFHRERVELALEHKEPDRLPLDLGGTAGLLFDGLYFRLKKHLKIENKVQPFRFGHTANYYDEDILDCLDIDIRRILPLRKKKDYTVKDNTFVDEWGVLNKFEGDFVNYVDHPLKEPSMEVLNRHPWPEPEEMFSFSDLREYSKYLFEKTDFALSLRSPFSGGFLDRACYLRGTENFFMDLYLNPDFAEGLLHKIFDIYYKTYDLLLSEVGEYLSIVENNDDYGTQESLLISPEMFKKYLKPLHMRLNKLIREKAPKAKTFLHSDGAVRELIDDFIDSGVEILNPIQASARDMDTKRLKEEFGDRICFHGGIEQKPLSGSKEQVYEELMLRFHTLGKDGGYIMAPVNHIGSDVPLENVIYLYETARQKCIY